jgi:alpha-L-rhamnosidase
VVTDKRYVANAYLAQVLSLAAWMAPRAGHAQDAAVWTKARNSLLATIRKTWWNAENSVFANGTQTSSVLALAFGIAVPEQRPALVRSLVTRIRTTDRNHIGTGLIGAQWLMRTLTEIGHASLAFEMATQRTYPSWGYMVEHDATTVWELWNGNTADPGMNSRNHVMLVGDLVTWCYEHLAGISPAAPGFAKLRMRPEPVGGLSLVEAEYHSVRGLVRSRWQRHADGAFEWQIQIPPNTTATILLPLPDRPEPAVTESGKPLSEHPEIRRLDSSPPGRMALEIPSGRFHFTVR